MWLRKIIIVITLNILAKGITHWLFVPKLSWYLMVILMSERNVARSPWWHTLQVDLFLILWIQWWPEHLPDLFHSEKNWSHVGKCSQKWKWNWLYFSPFKCVVLPALPPSHKTSLLQHIFPPRGKSKSKQIMDFLLTTPCRGRNWYISNCCWSQPCLSFPFYNSAEKKSDNWKKI